MNLPSLLAPARDALRDWSSPDINPFLARARRIDARGFRAPGALLAIAILWLVGLVALFFWARTQDDARSWADDGARLWIGLVWLVSWVMTRLRDAESLRQEVVKGRFEPIQLMPLSAIERVWLWSAPNVTWGALIALTMLPALVWGIGSLFSLREALLLIVLVLLTLWGMPNWAPLAWRIQAGVKPEKAKGNALEQMTGARTVSRMGDGLMLPPELAINARGWGGSVGFAAPIWIMTQIGLSAVLTQIVVTYWQGLPFHVRAGADEIWLNWPIFLVRWAGEAQPFYGFALAPLWLLLPIWLAGATIRLLRLAAVTGREPFWTPTRLTIWRRAQTVQGALIFVLLFGLLWPGAIEESWLTNWFSALGGGPTKALAAWWIIALAAGALATSGMWRAALEFPVGPLTLRAQAPRAARLAARGLGVALTFWAGACLLGWRWPIGQLWLQMLAPSLAVAAVWIGAQAALWSGHRGPRFTNIWLGWHALWLYAGPAGGAGLILLAGTPIAQLKAFFPLSPWTLWLMLRDPSVGASRIFWLAIGVHAILVVATGVCAWQLGRDKITAPLAPNAPEPNEIVEDLESKAQLAPAIPQSNPTVALKRRSLDAPDAWSACVLAWLARFDNAFLILETRRVLGQNLRTSILTGLGLISVAALYFVAVLPVMSVLAGVWPKLETIIALVITSLMAVGAALFSLNGIGVCYDRDRTDGSLEMLFLTPLAEAEIAWGKIGPYLVRAALILAVLAPLWLVALLVSPQSGQPLAPIIYLSVPLWLVACLARLAVVMHWLALKKREIGAGKTGFGTGITIMFATIGELSCFIGAGGLGVWLGWPYMVGVLALMALIYAVQTAWAWKRGLAELRRQRSQGAPKAK